jgi:hypothetical protein
LTAALAIHTHPSKEHEHGDFPCPDHVHPTGGRGN